MKRVVVAFVLLPVLFCVSFYPVYSQGEDPKKELVKTADVNRDGKPDVTYYSSDGKYVTKAEADTNYDGKHDVVVHIKDGKFDSAEVDTDYNGTADKQFSDVAEFNKWLNENKPDFNDKLNRADWRFDVMKF